MRRKAFIAEADLAFVLARLSDSMTIWVPAQAGRDKWAVEFTPFRPGVVPVLDRQSTVLPKKAVFPQAETLLRFRQEKDPNDPSRVKTILEDAEEIKPSLVFGARPCDVRGFLVFDRAFTGGPFVDGQYERRRAKALFATLVCREADDACFCSSVGSGPGDRDGSDLWVIPVEGGYVIEALNEKAQPLIEAMGGAPTELQETAAKKVQDEAAARHVGNLDAQDAAQAFKARFEDKEFWQAMAGQCLGCGICTFSCPTCYCFTITDETKGLEGERLRSWDSCMFPTYTMEASGHNPRATKFERYRNRVGHKFSYFPEKYEGMIACCGCGRCVRSCPSSVDIRKAVRELKEAAHACA